MLRGTSLTPTQSRLYIEGYLHVTKREARLQDYGALFSKTEKCYCFPCSSIIYWYLMFSTSYFKRSLSTLSINSVNAMPLWDFLQSHFDGGIENIDNSQIVYRNGSMPV